MKLETIFERNDKALKLLGFQGYDPQLYWYLPASHRFKLNPNFFNKFLRKLELTTLKKFPFLTIPYLRLIKQNTKEMVPYGLGLFLQSYCYAYQAFNDRVYLLEAESIEKLLKPLLVHTPYGLGAPNSKKKKFGVLNSSLTSNSTVYLPSTAEVFLGYYHLYKNSPSSYYYEICDKIIESIRNDYHIKESTDKGVCLDYSNVLDNTHILNANALAGGCLASWDNEIKSKKNIRLIEGLYDYLSFYMKRYVERNDILPYAGCEDKNNSNRNTYDCYHTGFTLRGYSKIESYLNIQSPVSLTACRRMLSDFVSDKNIVSSLQYRSDYDIHALAEYINTFSFFRSELTLEERAKYERVINSSLDFFFNNANGSYYYKRNGIFSNAMYMPRWGHGAMMNAISRLLLSKSND